MSHPSYTKEYFIAKFEKTFDDDWCVGEYEQAGRHCALGHCGSSVFKAASEAIELDRLLEWGAITINDGADSRYQQETPRARILAALRDLP